MLNKRIKNSISEKIFSAVEMLTDKIFDKDCENKYFHIISKIEEKTKDIIKNIIVTTIE